MSIPTTCQHWFKFPAPSGPTITGVCRKCGAVQTVPTMGSIRGEGRVKFNRALTGAGLPGMSPERAVKLLGLGRGALAWLTSQGASVRSDDDTYTDDDEMPL